jgi:hypothetical protein
VTDRVSHHHEHKYELTNAANADPVPPNCSITPTGQKVLHHLTDEIVEMEHTLSSAGNASLRIPGNGPF